MKKKSLTPEQEAARILGDVHQAAADKGISQYDIAREVGMAQPNINRAMTGNPTLTTLVKICRAIGLKISIK